jgi:LysM repeat protein
MKKEIFSLMLLAFLLLTIPLSGQDTNYPTKKVNGVEYYIYTVQASEGLYAISRKFYVSQGDINNVNPEIHSGLKVGQQILIPIVKKTTEVTKAEPEIKQSQQFIQHKVEKRQTLFAISRLYNVSQDELKKYNPDIEKKLREGDILLIPTNVKSNNTEVPKATQSTQTINYRTHEVLAKETLYSISKLYEVQVDEIVKLNPVLENKLSIGTVLKIPSKQTIESVEQKKENGVSVGSRPMVDLNKIFGNTDTLNTNKKKPIRIAFLLPFMLEHGKKDAGVDRFIDFYAGSLLAIYEARQKGVSFEIFTYDTEKSEQKISEVLTNDELKTVDFIIGPAFSNQVQFVTDFAKTYKIKTLIPFTSKVPDMDTNHTCFNSIRVRTEK